MRKSLDFLVMGLIAISITLLLHPRLIFGQQPLLVQLEVDSTSVILANKTNKINLKLTINMLTEVIEKITDNVYLVLEAPKILRDKLETYITKNGDIITGNLTSADDQIIITFTLEKDIKINETKELSYILNLTFKNVDCKIISKILSNDYKIQMYVKLNYNGQISNKVSLVIRAESEDFWRACFLHALSLKALGSWTEERFLLNLTFFVDSSLEIKHVPPFIFGIKVDEFEIDKCMPQVYELSCDKGVLKGEKGAPNRFSMILELPREALERDQLKVQVNYSELTKSEKLLPQLHVKDVNLTRGMLTLTLRNNGTLPYIFSNCLVAPERIIRVRLKNEIILNPNEEKQIECEVTIINDKTLMNRSEIILFFDNFTTIKTVFIIGIDEPVIEFLNKNAVNLTFKLKGNESLRLEIPVESPLRVSLEGFSILGCNAIPLKCTIEDDTVLVHGTLILPSDINLSLQVNNKGGPENRIVKVALSDNLKSEKVIAVEGKPKKRFTQLLILSVVAAIALVVLAVVVLSRRRSEEYPQIKEEVYFDLG